MNLISKAYASLYKQYDTNGEVLFQATTIICGKTLSVETERSLYNATGFDKVNALLLESGLIHKSALPLCFVINADADKFIDIESKLYSKAFDLLNRKYLQIMVNANSQLRLKRIGKREYSYKKGVFLTPIEAEKAIAMDLRVDAMETASRYTETHVGAFFKKKIKKASQFYETQEEGFDANLYLSSDYIAAEINTDELMTAIRYFIDKEDVFAYYKIEQLPTLYVLSGMPGSGKSTLANKMNAIVCSSDEIRKEFTGDVSGKTEGAIEFYLLNVRARQALTAGVDVIVDATALHKKSRHASLKNVANIPHKNVCLFFNCMFDETAKRNMNPDRDKHVPQERLEEMWESIEVPTLDEGFDEIYDIIVI